MHREEEERDKSNYNQLFIYYHLISLSQFYFLPTISILRISPRNKKQRAKNPGQRELISSIRASWVLLIQLLLSITLLLYLCSYPQAVSEQRSI